MTAKVLNIAIPTSPKEGRHEAGWLWLYLEDHQDGRPPSEHFFPQSATPETRFHCWNGGGGIGSNATEEEAMQRLHDYATERLSERIARLQAELTMTKNSLETLGTNSRNLRRFGVLEEWTPARANGHSSY